MTEPAGEGASSLQDAPSGRSLRGLVADSRQLLRIAYRDPEHLAERLTLYGAQRLGPPAAQWARDARERRPDTSRATVAEEVRVESARVARIDGAVAGTPFFIAFVPGYAGYLWQEGRMVLRTAALYGHDPEALETSAQLLALRGVHPTVDTARTALLAVRDTPAPDKPTERRPLRTWVDSVRALLIFGGFLSAPDEDAPARSHPRLRTAAGLLTGGVLWLFTWVFPVTFMVLMAWGCESHARELGRRALSFYGAEGETPAQAIAAAEDVEDRGHDARTVVRATLLFLSVALPIGFVAFVDHMTENSQVAWLTALGALVALSLVIATGVVAGRSMSREG